MRSCSPPARATLAAAPARVGAILGVGLALFIAWSPAMASSAFNINPSSARIVLEPAADTTAVAPPPGAAPRAVKVYRSMAEASHAGVNPLAKPKPTVIANEAVQPAGAGLLRWAVPGIGAVLVIAAIGWFGGRGRRVRA